MWWSRARWQAVARAGDLAPGQLVAVTVGGKELVLGRAGDRYFAVQRRCAHRGGDLAGGQLAGDRLICPQHGWRYSIETGGEDGIYGTCLEVYPVRVTGEQLEVSLTPRVSPRRR